MHKYPFIIYPIIVRGYKMWSKVWSPWGIWKYDFFHYISNTSCALKWNETCLILKFRKPKKPMGMKEQQHGFKPTNSLELQNAKAFVRKRLISTNWSNWKKDLRLHITMFSISDGNLSMLGLYRGLSNMKIQCTINPKKVYSKNIHKF